MLLNTRELTARCSFVPRKLGSILLHPGIFILLRLVYCCGRPVILHIVFLSCWQYSVSLTAAGKEDNQIGSFLFLLIDLKARSIKMVISIRATLVVLQTNGAVGGCRS